MTTPGASAGQRLRAGAASALVAVGAVASTRFDLPPAEDPLGWLAEVGPGGVLTAIVRVLLAVGLVHLASTATLATLSRALPALVPAARLLARGPTGRTALRLVGAVALTLGWTGAGSPPEAHTVGGRIEVMAPAAPQPPAARQGPVLRLADGPARHPLGLRRADAPPSPPARPAPAGDVLGSRHDEPPPAARAPTATAPSAAPEPGASDGALSAWVIRPGEHLWHVAEATVAAHGVPPSVQRVADYHRRLVDHTRATLPVPDDPDLVHPGTVVLRPPLDPR